MKRNKILASNKDKDIFFNELLNPSEPNKALKDAAARYKTKHKHGFTRDESANLKERYTDEQLQKMWEDAYPKSSKISGKVIITGIPK